MRRQNTRRETMADRRGERAGAASFGLETRGGRFLS
jgi:hypothetical protein